MAKVIGALSLAVVHHPVGEIFVRENRRWSEGSEWG
jgi:hypothetical protein